MFALALKEIERYLAFVKQHNNTGWCCYRSLDTVNHILDVLLSTKDIREMQVRAYSEYEKITIGKVLFFRSPSRKYKP